MFAELREARDDLGDIAKVLRTEDPTVLMDGMQSFAQLSSVGPEWKSNLLVKGTSKLVQGGNDVLKSDTTTS